MLRARSCRPGAARLALCVTAAALGAQLGARRASADVTSWELEVIAIVNQERAALGRAPLGTDVRLFNAIEGHTTWMASTDSLSHTGAGGSTLGTRITAAGYPWTAAGEVLAAGQESPEEVVLGRPCDQWCSTACVASRCDGWKESSGHWNILMSASYRDIGVAHVVDTNPNPFVDWWGADLGNSSSPATPVPEATSTSAAQPTATATTIPSTPTATRTATRTSTLVPTLTRTPTAPPTATRTRTTTSTPAPSALAPTTTPVPSATPRPSTPTPTITASPTATATRTALPAATRTALPSPTVTALPSATRTALPSATARPTVTLVPSATAPPTSPAPTATSPTAGPGALILARARMQALGSWEGTDVYLDGKWRATTSSDGWIAILDVTPGDHLLQAYKPGYLSSETMVTVEPGQVALAGETLLLAGDTVPDDVIGLADLIAVESAFGSCAGDTLYQRRLDADGSGCVDDTDLVLVNENFGRQGPTRWVPIPALP